MKQLLLSAILLLGALPAQALPGQQYPQLESWVKKHKFLSPWLIGETAERGGIPHYLTAFRQLKDNWFLDINIEVNGDSDFIQHRKSTKEDLYLLKKIYDASMDDYGRKWRNIDCKDVWARDNATAHQLLSNAYSPAVANDFKAAKLIYDGVVPIVASIGFGPNYENPDMSDLASAKEWGINTDYKTSIFKGNLYSYRKMDHHNFFNPDGLQEDKRSCPYLEIEPVQVGLKKANVFNHNMQIYKQWQAYDSAKNKRLEPANISIE